MNSQNTLAPQSFRVPVTLSSVFMCIFVCLFTFSVSLLASGRPVSEVITCTVLCVCACVYFSGENTQNFNHILKGVQDLENV